MTTFHVKRPLEPIQTLPVLVVTDFCIVLALGGGIGGVVIGILKFLERVLG